MRGVSRKRRSLSALMSTVGGMWRRFLLRLRSHRFSVLQDSFRHDQAKEKRASSLGMFIMCGDERSLLPKLIDGSNAFAKLPYVALVIVSARLSETRWRRYFERIGEE